jgi:transposase InsO family protein
LLPHPPSTIGKVLRRHGCSKLPRPARAPRCARRYERETPGELLHLDTKKLGRFWQPGKRVLGEQVGRRNRRAGWQHLHVAIDDHSRYGDAELLPSDRGEDCARFFERTLARYRELDITVSAVLTDNGAGYRSRAFAQVCARHRIRHLRTRPYSPRTNGKAERFIQTLLIEWAYARTYASSERRTRALWPYLRWYNRHRPHSSLAGRAPISRVSHLCGQDS